MYGVTFSVRHAIENDHNVLTHLSKSFQLCRPENIRLRRKIDIGQAVRFSVVSNLRRCPLRMLEQGQSAGSKKRQDVD